MAFDIMDFNETIVAEGLEGKIFMVYGSNNLGKSFQCSKFPKPMFIPLEEGLNALSGVRKLKISDWASFKDFTLSMVREKASYDRLVKSNGDLSKNKFQQFKDICETLVVDSVTALGKSCEDFVVSTADKTELYEGNRGQLYKRFENEFYRTTAKFMNLGFTIVWIAHEGKKTIDEDTSQVVPKGDWARVVKPIIDRCDIVAYLKSNGIDEYGKVVPSSAFLAETPEYFARTKWDNMKTYLPTFSADSLKKALEDAISQQKESGAKVGSFQDQLKTNASNELPFDEVKAKIGELVGKIYAFDGNNLEGVNMKKYQTIVRDNLDDNATVKDTTPKQHKALTLIYSQVKDLIEELGI